jgi:hypothetical protein
MENSGQIKGVISYMTKLTHTVNEFRFRFVNVEVIKVTKNGLPSHNINYDLEIIPKQSDIPYICDFFNCKSKHIIEEGCDMVSLSFGNVYPIIKGIYYNGERISRYGGDIPQSFLKKISEQIQQIGPKELDTFFYCGGKQRKLTLKITYELSDVYIDDGMTTDISVYCHQILVEGEPLENIPQDLAETIVGYMTEVDDLRSPLDSIVWNEVTKYMSLEDCEIWTHTYPYIRTIGDVEVNDYNYVNQSTFSSKLCSFLSGDY